MDTDVVWMGLMQFTQSPSFREANLSGDCILGHRPGQGLPSREDLTSQGAAVARD